ncbi:MAG: PAS domain-containing protein, partial [Gammaproteobacteria bacterium]|nr:PAS domain-containing protein [Gammaproteobacteria bacterium]
MLEAQAAPTGVASPRLLVLVVDTADADGQLRIVNGAQRAWFGLTVADMSGEALADVIGPDADAVLAPEIRQALASATPFVGRRNINFGDLGCLQVDVHISPQPAGSGSALVMLYAMPSAIITADAASDANPLFDIAEHMTGASTFDWDVGADEATLSETHKDLFGWPGDAAETGRIHYEEWLAAIHPEDRQAASDSIQAVLANPSTPYVSEYRIRRPDGTVRWVE